MTRRLTRRLATVAAAACLGAFAPDTLLQGAVPCPGETAVAPAAIPGVASAADAEVVAASWARAEPAAHEVVRDPREPATAEEWRTLFARLPTDEWGGGDVSVSVRLASGRRLWMYGDTMSRRNVFVHSSAIVTDGRHVDVANGGRQVLPVEPVIDGRRTVYWTETLTALEGEYVLVTTAPVSVNTAALNHWDFRRTDRRSRQGLIHVDDAGDVHFLGWVGWVPRPDIGMDGEDIASPSPGHFTYGVFVHAIRLADGTFLRTRNRNYVGITHRNPDGTVRYEMWRPLFESSPTRLDPYWGH